MITSGWIKTERKKGRAKWHYFTFERTLSLCGNTRSFLRARLEVRHITEAGNCLTCARILKKTEEEGGGMTYEATVRSDGVGYVARIGGCTASATSSAKLAVERAATKALGQNSKFTVKKKGFGATLVGQTWRETWLVTEI